jgi:hypothetical protein
VKVANYLTPAIAIFVAASTAGASDGCGTYPKDVFEKTISAGWSDCELKIAGEHPLWKKIPDAGTRITRFVFTEGHTSFFRFVTITEKPDGTGELKVGGGDRSERSRVFRRSRLSTDQISKLNLLAMQSGAWKFEIGSWDGDEIYMHCQLLEMERADAKGYRYSSVNIGCNHPTKLMPFVNEVVRVAGLKTLKGGQLFR